MMYKALYFVLVVLEFILPVFPIIGSCVVSAYTLLMAADNKRGVSYDRKNERYGVDKYASSRNNVKREATITIILLTVVYLIFNVPVVTYLSINLVYVYSDFQFSESHTKILRNVYMQNILGTHSVVINCVVNALLYFYRLHALRIYLKQIFVKFYFRFLTREPANADLVHVSQVRVLAGSRKDVSTRSLQI